MTGFRLLVSRAAIGVCRWRVTTTRITDRGSGHSKRSRWSPLVYLFVHVCRLSWSDWQCCYPVKSDRISLGEEVQPLGCYPKGTFPEGISWWGCISNEKWVVIHLIVLDDSDRQRHMTVSHMTVVYKRISRMAIEMYTYWSWSEFRQKVSWPFDDLRWLFVAIFTCRKQILCIRSYRVIVIPCGTSQWATIVRWWTKAKCAWDSLEGTQELTATSIRGSGCMFENSTGRLRAQFR